MTEATQQELSSENARPKVRIDNLLRSCAVSKQDEPQKAKKHVTLRFLLNPVEIRPSPEDPSRVGSVVCERTRLEGEPGKQRAVGTGQTEEIPADLVLVSIGYKGEPLVGFDHDVVFDSARGIYRNDHGKIVQNSNCYVSGWLKRGPSGIIGTNINDARETVATLLATVNPSETKPGRAGLEKLLKEREVDVVDWKSYLAIDAKETSDERKRSNTQPREKFTSIAEMMDVVHNTS